MIEYPAEPTYWIITAGGPPVAGVTMPNEVTSAGPQWTVIVQTIDRDEWQAECERLGLTPPDAVPLPPDDELR